MSVFDKLSFLFYIWAYRRQDNKLVQFLLKLTGVSSVFKIWVAVNEQADVCGATGLYTLTKDKDEAVWLLWFCVDPNNRRKGIGKELIEFTISKAKEFNKKYFRLHTSSDLNEEAAQKLYEKYGFEIRKEMNKKNTKILLRELKIGN
jgi:ribosomal protein S18 acetylase RimI-like enzyme